DNGGLLASVEDAEFLFSQDTETRDTESLFLSEAYLEEHLAIFHPNYICECVKKGNTKDVVLGQYFFPPKDVQNLARKQLQFKWDLDGNTSDGTEADLQADEDALLKNPESKHTKKKSSASPKKSPPKATNVNMNDSLKDKHNKNTSAKIAEPRPGPSSYVDHIPERVISEQICTKKNTSDNSVQKVQVKKTVVPKTIENNVSLRRMTPTQGIDILKKPHVNSSVCPTGRKEKEEMEECLRLEDLAKVPSDLQDFIVGQNGCELVLLS
ncbi:hypothetical protein DPMN_110648, partial [Dreissena polymorpha]